jgi:hypothetical protein
MANATQAQKDYYAKNKADAKVKEDKALYELTGSRGDAARKGMEEGRMDAMGTAYKKGGKVKKYNGEEGSEVFSKAEPYLKKAVEKMDKSLGVTKETSPELQKSFAEKLERLSRSGGGGGGAGIPKVGPKKPMDMKSGGKVSSASKRADGIAIRGKTRA